MSLLLWLDVGNDTFMGALLLTATLRPWCSASPGAFDEVRA